MVREQRLIPDGYVVSRDERFLHFFEIEIYNPMTRAKLESYARMMVDFDSFGFEFAVLSVNKHGHITPVDLRMHYFNWLSRMAERQA
ncbi:hypothetical protein SAMN02787076_06273 [Rhizobacter sp. OV335]|nr:hypothetical protein SAMN02787076_06273 [Rhizobacter sp. OV335]